MAARRGAGITPLQEEYLVLLRSAIWGTETPVLPSDINGVLSLADKQRTRPLVLFALQKAGWSTRDRKKKELIINTAASHLTLNSGIAKMVTALREEGIEPVLLKGQGVAQNYPDPMQRECGDIDLYVGLDNYAKACSVVKALAGEDAVKKSIESDKHYHVKISGLTIEIHRVCDIIPGRKRNAFFQELANEGLSRDLLPIVFDGVTVSTPSDSFNAFYIFHHAWHHFLVGGIGLRQVCDWMMFLHSRAGKLDTSVVDRALAVLRLRRQWEAFGAIAVDYLGFPAGEMPYYDPGKKRLAAKVLTLIFEEGNFGHSRKELRNRPKGYFAGKAFSVKIFFVRLSKMFRLFPLTGLFMIPVFFVYGFRRVAKDLSQK